MEAFGIYIVHRRFASGSCAYQKLYPSGFITLIGLEDVSAGDRETVFRAERAACAAAIELFRPEARTDSAADLLSPISSSSQAVRRY